MEFFNQSSRMCKGTCKSQDAHPGLMLRPPPLNEARAGARRGGADKHLSGGLESLDTELILPDGRSISCGPLFPATRLGSAPWPFGWCFRPRPSTWRFSARAGVLIVEAFETLVGDTLRRHLAWAGPLLGLLTFGESLALVGAVVPATAVMT